MKERKIAGKGSEREKKRDKEKVREKRENVRKTGS